MSTNETPEQKAKRLGVPLIPRQRPQPKQRDVIAVCGECGLELRGTMGYVCPKQNCPTGLGSAFSLSPEKYVDVVRPRGPELLCHSRPGHPHSS